MLPDGDSSTPLFFVSYARAGLVRQADGPEPGPKDQVASFFDDLSVDVAELVHRRPGADPGFMDNGSMQDSGRWSNELLRAAGGCQVFVALLCVPYMSGEWCGMEWGAFSQRKVSSLEEGAAINETFETRQ